jgi:hypothetical protein
MCGYISVARVSLAAFWSISAYAAAYVPRQPAARSIVSGSTALSRRDASPNANVTKPFIVDDFPVTEDGRCGATFGTKCWSDECCSAEGYVNLLSTRFGVNLLIASYPDADFGTDGAGLDSCTALPLPASMSMVQPATPTRALTARTQRSGLALNLARCPTERPSTTARSLGL